MEIVRKEGVRVVKRSVDHYNLDMIISIGYRVNSIQETRFHLWANQILKEYLLKGYALDQKRFKNNHSNLMRFAKQLNSDEVTGLVKVLTAYAYALDILDKYDHQVIEISSTTPEDVLLLSMKMQCIQLQN